MEASSAVTTESVFHTGVSVTERTIVATAVTRRKATVLKCVRVFGARMVPVLPVNTIATVCLTARVQKTNRQRTACKVHSHKLPRERGRQRGILKMPVLQVQDTATQEVSLFYSTIVSNSST